MKKIFIAYADAKMAYSLKRIGRQARSLQIFDEVILYTPKQLPQYILDSPLMKHSYGGGYWAWKPCIIYETLKEYGDEAVVCYVDAGCTLKKGIEWTLYFELMKTYDTLCFKYRDEMLEWERFGSISTKIRHWGKKNLLLFLDELVGNEEYRKENKVLGGILFFKGSNNLFLKEWLDITINHPEVIIDPSEEELGNQYSYFALHKHDQPVLTALAYKYCSSCMVLPEMSETVGRNAAIRATRCRARTVLHHYWNQFKKICRSLFGPKFYTSIKKALGK